MTWAYDAAPPLLLNSAYVLLAMWGIVAYLTAAIAGIRALRQIEGDAPARPYRLISDATRWVFRRPMSTREWQPRDFIALGVFVSTATSVMWAVFNMNRVWDVGAMVDGVPSFWIWAATMHVITGSTSIVLHCGAALYFQREAQP